MVPSGPGVIAWTIGLAAFKSVAPGLATKNTNIAPDYKSAIQIDNLRYARFRLRPTWPSTTDGGFAVSFPPSPHRHPQLFSVFVQDQITLVEDTLSLTLGSKFEHNDHTGFEVQPTARFLWTPAKPHSAWAAASRAVRTPGKHFEISDLKFEISNLYLVVAKFRNWSRGMVVKREMEQAQLFETADERRSTRMLGAAHRRESAFIGGSLLLGGMRTRSVNSE